MSKTLISACAAAGLLLTPAAALAGHGRPGLWKITSSTKMPNMPKLPPEAMAMMKSHGTLMGQPIVSQICMTREQVEMDRPPAMEQEGQSCTSKVLNQTASSVTAEITCTGRVNGKGRTQVNWRGTDHYDGTYTFKGAMEGQVQEISTRYSGDFVKTDCGAVKPPAMPKKP